MGELRQSNDKRYELVDPKKNEVRVMFLGFVRFSPLSFVVILMSSVVS